MSTLADDIGHNLQFYNYLDPITRRLNAPGVRHFVRGDDFSQMLAKLDECLSYMETHVSFFQPLSDSASPADDLEAQPSGIVGVSVAVSTATHKRLDAHKGLFYDDHF